MELLHWYSRLETGIELIDNDHKVIIEKINDLYKLYRTFQGREAFFTALGTLRLEVFEHFEREQFLMESHAYPKLEAHILQHKELLEQLDTIINTLNDGSKVVSITTMTFLKDWFTYHIRGSDMQFAEFCRLNSKD